MNVAQQQKRMQRGSKSSIITPPTGIMIPDDLKYKMDLEAVQKHLRRKKAEIYEHNKNIATVSEDLKSKTIFGNHVLVKLFKIDSIKVEKAVGNDDEFLIESLETVPIRTESGTQMIEIPNPLPYIYAGCIHAIGNLVAEPYSYLKVGMFVEMGHEVDLQRNMYYVRKNETDKEPDLDTLQSNEREMFPLWEGIVKIPPAAIESCIDKDYYKWSK